MLKDLVEKAKPAVITTVGFLLYEDDEVMLVACTVDGEHKLVGNAVYLLKAVTVSVVDL